MKQKHAILIALLAWVTCGLYAQKRDVMRHGYASYYHDRFHGRRTASGEKYNKDSFTCAHLKYPLGTFLHVRNVANGKECVVRVTDRGPYSQKFIIDLSRAAAQYLGIIHAPSWVELTPTTPTVPYKLIEESLPELGVDYDPASVITDPAWKREETPIPLPVGRPQNE